MEKEKEWEIDWKMFDVAVNPRGYNLVVVLCHLIMAVHIGLSEELFKKEIPNQYKKFFIKK